jgi:dolichol-phosphate mannosyltransferase
MPAICDRMAARHDWLRAIHRAECPGVGNTIAEGLKHFRGDVIAIMMADGSDSGEDLVACYQKMLDENTDCVFGSRWMRGGRVENYPKHKLVLNRLANQMVRLFFWIRYDDVTNAFKLYKRGVIEGIQPILSQHFNILVELPLKAIVRGYTYSVLPISWKNRKSGVAKLKIREMGSRYIFIILYVLLEKWLSMQDYCCKDQG